MQYRTPTITRSALSIVMDSVSIIRYYDSDGDCDYPLLTPADLNRAKYVKFGNDIRLIKVI